MSRVADLLHAQCPDGVERRALGDMLSYEQPGKYLVTSTGYDNAYPTPVLTAGQTFVLGYTDETDGIYQASAENPVVIFDDFTTAFKWVDFPFKAKSSAMKMLTSRPDSPVLLRFAYYAMQTIAYRPQEHTRQWIATYANFGIPVPPLEVQREVVRTLDLFVSLESELKAEREARQIQYRYYLDKLLAFHDVKDVTWEPLGTVGDFFRGKRFTKADYVTDGIPCIHYGEIYTEFGTTADHVISHLRPELRPRLRFAQPGDVVLVDVGETVEDVGKAVAWLGAEEVAIHDHCYVFRHDMNPTFVSYYMQTSRFHADKEKHVARTKVKTLLMDGLAKVLIPVPARAEQDRVVRILNTFGELVDDPSIGLPAELSARRVQYEHYRDRVMGFDEVPA